MTHWITCRWTTRRCWRWRRISRFRLLGRRPSGRSTDQGADVARHLHGALGAGRPRALGLPAPVRPARPSSAPPQAPCSLVRHAHRLGHRARPGRSPPRPRRSHHEAGCQRGPFRPGCRWPASRLGEAIAQDYETVDDLCRRRRLNELLPGRRDRAQSTVAAGQTSLTVAGTGSGWRPATRSVLAAQGWTAFVVRASTPRQDGQTTVTQTGPCPPGRGPGRRAVGLLGAAGAGARPFGVTADPVLFPPPAHRVSDRREAR